MIDVVHLLEYSRPRCGFTLEVPRYWPPGHKWLSLSGYRSGSIKIPPDVEICAGCAAAAAPRRIRRTRAKGWRMPQGAIYCGRPSAWGNPFFDWQHPKRLDEKAVLLLDGTTILATLEGGPGTERDCVFYFERWVLGELPEVRGIVRLTDRALRIRKSIDSLRGSDLVCWCALEARCHVDVYLRLANAPKAAA